MKKFNKNLFLKLAGLGLVIMMASCAQESLEAEFEIASGGGILTTYKSYAIDSVSGTGLEVYGRAVFWKGLEGNTYLQVSLYNVGSEAVYPSGIFSGELPGGSELMPLYDIVNTGESYDFGEFSVSKYYTITTERFFDDLDGFNANIQIFIEESGAVIASGDIGMNADPLETSD